MRGSSVGAERSLGSLPWAALGHVAQALADELTLERVATVLVEQAAAVLECSVVALWFVDPPQEEARAGADMETADVMARHMYFVAQHGVQPDVVREYGTLPLIGSFATVNVARIGWTVVVPDTSVLGDAYRAEHPVIERLGVQSYCIQPLVARGQVVGILNCAWSEPSQFTEEDKTLRSVFADLCAVAIDKARLYEETLQRAQEAEQARGEVKSILESMTDAFLAMDHEWRLLYVNAEAERILSQNVALWSTDLLGRNFWEVAPWFVGSRVEEACRQAVASGGAVTLEDVSPRSGHWYAARFYPSERGLSIYFQDTTERKRADEESTARAAQLEATFEAIADGVFVFDAEGRFRQMNAAARLDHILDVTPEEYYAQPPGERARLVTYCDETGQPLAAEDWPVRRILAGEVLAGPTAQDVLYRSAEGREMLANVTGAPVRDSAGRIIGGVAVIRDVMARRRQERQSAFLAAASALLAASLDYKTTLQNVAQLAVPGLADWCTVHLVTDDEEIVLAAIAHTDPAQSDWARVGQEQFLPRRDETTGIAQVLRSGRAVLYEDIAGTLLASVTRSREHGEILQAAGYTSSISVPLPAHGRIFGALSLITTTSGRVYGPEDVAFCEELGRRAGSTVEHARLYEAARESRATAERLQAVTAALSEALTPLHVAQTVVEEGLSALGVDAGSVFGLSDDGVYFELLGYRGYAREREGEHLRVPVERSGPLGDALLSRDLVVVESADELRTRWPYLASLQAESGDATTMAAPLIVRGRVLGILYGAFRAARRVSTAERAFVVTLARQCAQALERARLYEAEQLARAQAEAVQEQLRAIIEAMTDSVFVFGHGRNIVHANRAARDLFGLDVLPETFAMPQEGREVGVVVQDEEARALPIERWPVFRALGGEVLTGASAADVLIHMRDGQTLELSVTGAPLRGPAAEIAGAVCVARDVTERRRLERRTHEALSALLRMGEALVLRDEDNVYDKDDAYPAVSDEDTATVVAHRLAELTCSVLGCRRAAISAVNPATGAVRPVAAAGFTPEHEALWRRGGRYARLKSATYGSLFQRPIAGGRGVGGGCNPATATGAAQPLWT